jgi:hypothetical protein
VAAAVLAALIVAGGVVARSAGGPGAGRAPLHTPQAVPAQGAGDATVTLSADAGTHPAGAAVRDQLQRYFDAINARDYAAWRTTVVQQRADEQPEQAWRDGVDTTADGTVRVDRIDDLDGGRLLARVRFVSTQDVSDAPADLSAPRLCWRASLPMSGSPPLLETGRAENVQGEAC